MEYKSKYTGAKVDALLDKVESGDVGGKVTVDSALSTESENPVMNKVITDALNDKQDSITDLGTIRSNANKGATAVQPNDLSRVATSGSYNDLSNTPDIPSEITESTVSGWGFTKNVGTYVKPNGGIPKEDLSDAVQESLDKADTALQTHQDISHLATKDELEDKQESLVSGVNIKTINGESVLGEGNIEIKGGGESYDDSELRGLIEGKQDKLEDNVNIKTINGTSLLGSGNIVISGEGGESYDDTELRDMIANKVDKIEGKGLSTEDYTTEEKEKLTSLKNYDDSGLKDDISKKQDKLVSGESIKTVNGESILGSGDITIPSESYDDTVIKADIESLKTSKVNKSDVATINGQSLLNGGNITISGGGSSYDDTELRNLIANKADKSGEYLDMSVGLAEDLGNRPFYDEAEFSFRSSAGEASVKDGLATIVKLKGNSVVWNQKLIRDNKTTLGITTTWVDNIATLSGTATSSYAEITDSRVPVFNGHKYLVEGWVVSNPNSLSFGIGLFNNIPEQLLFDSSTAYKAGVFTCNGYYRSGFGVNRFGGAGTDLTGLQVKARVIDLTQMFSAGKEPTTIEEFNARKPIVADEYAYNEGQVIHCNTESIKSVGDNAWDEQWENGGINSTSGSNIKNDDVIRSTNYIRVIEGEDYHINVAANTFIFCYDKEKNFLGLAKDKNGSNVINNETFVLLQGTAFIRFYTDVATYNHDICISLVHSGWKQDTDAGYQPYWQDTLPLPIIRKYFPDGMKSAGTAKDEIRYNKASGKWEYSKGKIKSVDLGGFNWSMSSETYPRFYAKTSGTALPPDVDSLANLLCVKYDNKTAIQTYYGEEGISLDPQEYLRVYAPNYTDEATFKAAMQGVILYYEAADWEWVELDAEDQNFNLDYKVADFGTEQAIAEQPSAPIRAKIEYGFGANDTIRTNKLAISALKKELRDSYATTQSVREAIEEAITTTLNTKV